MTLEQEILSAVLCPILVLAVLLHIVTLRHAALYDKELAKAGKRLMAAGFLIIFFRYSFIPYYPVAVLGALFVSLGSVFTCLERLEDMVNRIKYRDIQEDIRNGTASL